MIDVAYVRLMARYNAEMNRRWLEAASRLSDADRRADRGAFFGSIHGTFNHLLWADRVWLWRLAGAERPAHPREESARLIEAWADLVASRIATDEEILAWADAVTPEALAQPVEWFEGRQGAFRSSQALRVVHMFTHQVHHRGQIHALLTASGEDTAETSVWVTAQALALHGSAAD